MPPPSRAIPAVVVDASVWVSSLAPQDIHHEVSRRWLEQHTTGGGLLVAPLILFIEVAGAIARRTGRPSLAQQAEAHLWRVPRLRVVSLDIRAGRQAARLAATLSLRGADAVYVAVADGLRLPLVTWDSEQAERALPVVESRTPADLSPSDGQPRP